MKSTDEFVKTYLEMINGPLLGLNLTRITSPDEFKHKQFEDSVIPFRECQDLINILKQDMPIIDIGFGGGFPVLPLAWSYRTTRFLGIETREKKVKAVKNIAGQLGLTNVNLQHGRYEEINYDRPALIVSKAVDKIENILKALTITAPCYVGFYKGRELDEVEDLHATKDELVVDFSYQILGDHQRRFLLYKCVPRGTNSKKKLVNLSAILLP